jgi:hypothetical protein
MYDECEAEFSLAKHLRIAEQSADPRFANPTPATSYIAEKDHSLRNQDS